MKPSFIIPRHCSSEPDNPFGDGIAMGFWVVSGLTKLFDDMRRCRHVGIAHTKIDDIAFFRTQLRFQLVDLLKDIRRQLFDTIKLFRL